MKRAILFVHGLGGGSGTWGKFKELIECDADLPHTPFFYEYPSFAFRVIPVFQEKYGNIQSLSSGLSTYIDHTLDDYEEIVLVGHSLGGLIIRQYLMNKKIAARPTKIKKVIFYAVPQEGAKLAEISSLVSFNHRHLKQLCRNSEFLDTLNDQWAISKIENDFEFKVVVAIEDAIVSPQSAKSNFRHLEPDHVPGKGHKSVSKPTDKNDLVFIILKKFLLSTIGISRSRPKGSLKFEALLRSEGATPFFPDTKRERIIEELRDALLLPRNAVRITGLSGLGKTRVAVEAIKKLSDQVQNSVVYIDVAIEPSDLMATVHTWASDGAIGILVADNCPVAFHDQLLKATLRPESKLTLLTIDSDLQNSGACKYVELGRLDDEMIKKMLTHNFGDSLTDINRVVDFAQGFPQMAVLIAEARINLEPNIGKLTDDHIAHKLLWGAAQEPNVLDEKILRGCALFDRFGLESEASPEFKYIASKIVDVKDVDFYECVTRFAERGLIDKRGRYAQLVPKPLAIRLAAQWWGRNPQQAHESLINGMPDSLVTSFCEQIGKLDFLPEVKTFTANLCGNQGPFGQAEVILSSRGSRLFRAFVDVNPEVTSSALHEVVTSLSPEKVGFILGDVRRNLVFALERLCFHAHLFDESAWTLLQLGISENETWGNNASGIFAQLFRVQLSGTEAAPAVRFALIRRALDLNELSADLVILAALRQALNTRGGSRTVGAEYQGTKKPLQEWQAKIWQEIFDFWQSAFDVLIEMTFRGERQTNDAKEIIGHSIRSFVNSGRFTMLDATIRKIIAAHGRYWPSALDSIKMVFEYDTGGLDPASLNMLNEWLKLLDPQESSMSEKLMILVKNPPWEHRENENGDYVDVAAENAQALARELSKDLDALAENIPMLIEGEQKQAYAFGLQLVMTAKAYSDFLSSALTAVRSADHPNINFCLGMFAGIFKLSQEDWDSRLSQISNDDGLRRYYPDFLRTGELRADHLGRLFDLIHKGHLTPESAGVLGHGSITSAIDPKIMMEFCSNLSKVSDVGASISLNILFMYCYSDPDKFDATRLCFKELVLLVPLNDGRNASRLDMHSWNDSVKKLLITEDVKFASDLCQRLIKTTSEGMSHSDIWHSIKPLLRSIMEQFAQELWPLFASAIELSKGMDRYWLQQLLERDAGIANKQPSVLSVVPIELIMDSCRSGGNDIPTFIATCADIFNGDGLEKQPTKLFIALLENFVGDENVCDALLANMNTRGWSGSLVPYLEGDKAGLSHLLTHPNRRVQSWAKKIIGFINGSIARESTRDEERGLGIY